MQGLSCPFPTSPLWLFFLCTEPFSSKPSRTVLHFGNNSCIYQCSLKSMYYLPQRHTCFKAITKVRYLMPVKHLSWWEKFKKLGNARMGVGIVNNSTRTFLLKNEDSPIKYSYATSRKFQTSENFPAMQWLFGKQFARCLWALTHSRSLCNQAPS